MVYFYSYIQGWQSYINTCNTNASSGLNYGRIQRIKIFKHKKSVPRFRGCKWSIAYIKSLPTVKYGCSFETCSFQVGFSDLNSWISEKGLIALHSRWLLDMCHTLPLIFCFHFVFITDPPFDASSRWLENEHLGPLLLTWLNFNPSIDK